MFLVAVTAAAVLVRYPAVLADADDQARREGRKVLLEDVPDLGIARGVEDEARKVGLRPTLELGSGG